MKKTILTLLTIIIGLAATAQNSTYYVCYSTGLNIHKTASLKAELVGKIPYGTKLNIAPSKTDTIAVSVEGMQGYWVPVTYQGKKGYIVSCYLTSLKPPKKGTKTMEDYLLQITTTYGGKLMVSNDVITTIEAGGRQSSKQLYKNGAQHNTFKMYEYSSDTYMLPKISLYEAFLITRQIDEFSDLYTEKDEFPTKSGTWEKQLEHSKVSYRVSVMHTDNDKTMMINKISMMTEDDMVIAFDMYMLEDEVVIFKSYGR